MHNHSITKFAGNKLLTLNLIMHYHFIENQVDHTLKTHFDWYEYFAKDSVRQSDSHEDFFFVSTKHNTFPFQNMTLIKHKNHSN